MIEEDIRSIMIMIRSLHIKVDALMCATIPKKKDNSKHLAEAKQTANKGKPPRKQPKKEGKTIVSVQQGKLPSQLLEEAEGS